MSPEQTAQQEVQGQRTLIDFGSMVARRSWLGARSQKI